MTITNEEMKFLVKKYMEKYGLSKKDASKLLEESYHLEVVPEK